MGSRGGGPRAAPGFSPEAAPPPARDGADGPPVALAAVWGEVSDEVAARIGDRIDEGMRFGSGGRHLVLVVAEASWAGVAAPAFRLKAAALAEAALRNMAQCRSREPEAAPSPARPGGSGPKVTLVGYGEASKVAEWLQNGREETGFCSGGNGVVVVEMEVSGAGVPARAFRLEAPGLTEAVLRDMARAPPPARPGGEISRVGEQVDQEESSGGYYVVLVEFDVSGAAVPARAVWLEAPGLAEAVLQIMTRCAMPNATAGSDRTACAQAGSGSTAALSVLAVSGLVTPADGGIGGGRHDRDPCDCDRVAKRHALFVGLTGEDADAAQDYTVKLDNPRTLAANYHFSLSRVQPWLFCFVMILLFARVESCLDCTISNTSFCPAPHLQFKKPMSYAAARISKTSNILFQEMETECKIVELQGSQCRKQSIYIQVSAVLGTTLAMISNLGPLIPILRIGQVTPARRSLLCLCSISLSTSYFYWSNCNSMKSLSSAFAGLVSLCLGIGFGLLACSEFVKLGPEILSGANTISGISGVCGVILNAISFGLRVLSGSGQFDQIPFVLTLCGTIGSLISCATLWMDGSSRISFEVGLLLVFGGRAIEAYLMYSYKQAPRGNTTSNDLTAVLLGSASQGNNMQENSEGAQDGDSELDAITKDVGQHVADLENCQDVPKQAPIVQGYSTGEGKTHESKTDEEASTTKAVQGTLKPEKRQSLCEEEVKGNVENKPGKDDSTDNVTAEAYAS